MKVRFRVQRQVLSGLKYIQVTKRKGIRVAKDEEMIVCYELSMNSLIDVMIVNTLALGFLSSKYQG